MEIGLTYVLVGTAPYTEDQKDLSVLIDPLLFRHWQTLGFRNRIICTVRVFDSENADVEAPTTGI